jgi:hypothetical protein
MIQQLNPNLETKLRIGHNGIMPLHRDCFGGRSLRIRFSKYYPPRNDIQITILIVGV